MLGSDIKSFVDSDPDASRDNSLTATKATESDDQSTISVEELRGFLHDLNGPLASARGFAEELVGVCDSINGLLNSPELSMNDQLKESLQHQIDDEMKYCLDRVRRSLEKLDSTIEMKRVNTRLTCLPLSI